MKIFDKCYLLFISSILSASINLFAIHIKPSGEALLLLNMDTGVVLYDFNGSKKAFPASTTKIATALMILSNYRHILDDIVSVNSGSITIISPNVKKQSGYKSPPFWLEADGSHMGLKPKEQIEAIDLLYGMLVGSANDAANVLAFHSEKSIPKFMQNMNVFLKKIGCTSTNFNNPHGLHHPDHFTTAHDLAIMAREAMLDPLFSTIVATEKYRAKATNLEEERFFSQTNRLLNRSSPNYYSKAIGIKTGYTKDSGKNLVAAASYKGRSLIAIALGYKAGDAIFKDLINIFEQAFNEPLERKYLIKPGTVLSMSMSGAAKKVTSVINDGLYYDLFPSEHANASFKYCIEISKFPICKGDYIGYLSVLINGKEHSRQSLYSEDYVKKAMSLIVKEIWNSGFLQIFKKAFCIVTAVIMTFFILKSFRKKKRRVHRF